jgi:glycyl-tRNA synthetase
MYSLEELVNYCKQTGYIFQASEIYGGLANTYDYGPLGSLLKQNIKNAWLKKFCFEPDNVFLDSSILLNNKVWEASGHLTSFSDPLIECSKCHTRYRVDKLLEEKGVFCDGLTLEELEASAKEHHISCPCCGAIDFLPIRKFNLMFKTFQGVVEDSSNQIYLRPETAQGIFINFKNVARTSRKRVPFGICQIGKSFRNEISPGNFIFRTREFEQMELEFFCKPNTELEHFATLLQQMQDFLVNLGIDKKNINLHEHPKEALSHYSNRTCDVVFNFPWGFDELWGIASRTDFDLKAHQQLSKEKLDYVDDIDNTRYVPYVVEPSLGVERFLLAILFNGLRNEVLEDGTSREVLDIHPFLAPFKCAIFPLMKKNHGDKAKELFDSLKTKYSCTYDEAGNIGKRYRRQDQIGTPICITVDDNTLNDNTVTIRSIKTMKQVTLNIKKLEAYIDKLVKF